MTQINGTLKSLILEGETSGDVKTQTNINGETFQVTLTIGKEGINLELVPTNPTGDMILNLSEDELKSLHDSLKDSLTMKFGKYRMKITGDESNPNNKSLNFTISTDSLVDFIKKIMSM